MSEWQPVRLGDVTVQARDVVKVGAGSDYPLLGVKWYAEGPFLRETVTSETSKATTLYRVTPGQFIYNRMFAWKGAFGVVGEDLAGSFVSNEFPLFDCDPGRLLPEFLGLHFRQPQVWDWVSVVSTGTTASRSRWKEALFADYTVALPSLTEQRRIVDVMAAVDAQIEALEAEAGALGRAVGPMTESLLADDLDWPVRALGEVGEFIRGRRFIKSDYVSEGLGVIHYSHIHTHFGPVCREVVARVPEAMSSRLRLAHTGDVIIAATSEDLAGVGKATVWLGDEEVAVHDDAQIYRHSLDPLFASFVFASPAFQAQKVQYAGGTKVTRISGADMAKISVPMPPATVQQRVGEALADAARQAELVAQEARDLRETRSTLLTALLSQQVTVPESYDVLLDDAVEVSA